MERFLTRKEANTNVPVFYQDVWTLLVPFLEWPELYAFSCVCHATRKAAMPLLGIEVYNLRKDFLVNKLVLKEAKKGHYRWNFNDHKRSDWDFKSTRHPIHTHRRNFLGLLRFILLHKGGWNKNNIWEIERKFGAAIARFARIDGIITCHRPKSFYCQKPRKLQKVQNEEGPPHIIS